MSTDEYKYGSTRGLRLNNPGNIKHSKDKWRGLDTEQPDEMFCKFILPEYGVRAMCKVILTYAQHRKAADGTSVDTISDIITRWAPPYENDTADYIKNVSEWSGVPADAVLDLRATGVLEALVRGITRQENGCMPYPDTVISAGVRMALNSTK